MNFIMVQPIRGEDKFLVLESTNDIDDPGDAINRCRVNRYVTQPSYEVVVAAGLATSV